MQTPQSWGPPAPVGANSPYPGTDNKGILAAFKRIMEGNIKEGDLGMLGQMTPDELDRIAKNSKLEAARTAAAQLLQPGQQPPLPAPGAPV